MVRSRVGAVMMLLAAITSGCRTVRPEQAPGSGLSDGVHEFASGDARLWYRVAGRSSGAPPVVFLHGGPGQGSAHFDALAGPYLEPTLRMVYFDQRGSGHSERPESRNYAIPTLVEDIEALRRELGVPKIALIGHSFGAVLGLEYAARYPEHVARLVVAAGLWDTPYQCRLRAERLARVRPEAWARVRGDTLAENGTRRSDCDVEYLALSDPAERATVIEAAADLPRCPALPRALRPLAVLAGLAHRSLARGGTALLGGPGAMLYAMRVGITGR